MGLLGGLSKSSNNPSPGKKFSITTEDKKWVDICYKWLLKNYGHPVKGIKPFLFTEKDFPVTFAVKKVTIDNLLDDLCKLFKIDGKRVDFELEYDIRDIPMTPHSIQGKAFESELIPKADGEDISQYTIYIANDLMQRELILLRRLIVELSKIKLIDKNPEYKNADLTLFSYIASVFFGFSVLISQALVEIGVQYRAGWQRNWSSKSEVPYQVIAYAVANYSKLIGDESPAWENNMPASVKEEFTLAMDFLKEHPDENTFLDEKEFENLLKVRRCWEQALQLSKDKQYAEAIELYKLSMSISSDKKQLSLAYINCGYAYLMTEQYEESLVYYNKALDIRPDYAYAYANMGYIYIMTGQLEKAKEYLEKVDAYNKSLTVYLLRDWALYYMQAGNRELAEDYFQRAFNTGADIDLLEYFYAKFLLSQSQKEEAIKYLNISVGKGEKQGIELRDSLKIE